MTPEHEARLFKQIIDRYQALMPTAVSYAGISLALRACTCICPLDLEKLLASSDVHFIHDVSGIVRNLDADAGKLLYDFRPFCVKE
jgi:hypothetical protein